MMRSRILISLLLLFAAACRQTETTIIRSPAITPNPASDVFDDASIQRAASTLRIADLVGWESFDPLIARTSSDDRNIQWVYEGLMRLDASGAPVPALAASVDISADSTTYTFHLRDDAFYHNDPAFSNGIGRKVHANDVIAAFERMTRRDVPETAAKLFSSQIVGFDLRNRENRDLYVASLRQTKEITGIQRIDSRTVRFKLNAPDRWFLHRLASPKAVIYAPEAVSVINQRPVGSGPFRYQSQSGDTLLTFVLNSAHPDTSQFSIRRLDVQRIGSETRAYRSLMKRESDVISESGPVLASGVRDLSPDAVTITAFRTSDHIAMRWNPDNVDGLSFTQAATWFNLVWIDSLTQEFARSGYDRTFLAAVGTRGSGFTSAFKLTEHPHEDQNTRRMVIYLRKSGDVEVLKGYVVNRDVTFYTTTSPRHIPFQDVSDPHDLVRFDIRGYRLSHPAVTGLDAAPHSWWFDLRGVRLNR